VNWISINIALPENKVPVLVFEKYEDLPFIAYLSEKGAWELENTNLNIQGRDGHAEDDIFQDQVTHWQPLPEPPK